MTVTWMLGKRVVSWERNENGSGLCPMAGRDTSGVQPLASMRCRQTTYLLHVSLTALQGSLFHVTCELLNLLRNLYLEAGGC
jgi:hypothetical protein